LIDRRLFGIAEIGFGNDVVPPAVWYFTFEKGRRDRPLKPGLATSTWPEPA